MALPTRKKQAKKPTGLPAEFLKTVRGLFQKQFKAKAGDSEFLIYGDLYSDEVILCVSLTHPKSLAAATLYLSMEIPANIAENPEKVTEQLRSMVDVAASWFAQGFDAGSGLEAVLENMRDASTNWDGFQWEGKTLYAKLSRDNLTLDKAADKFLREAGIEPSDEDVTEEELEEIMAELEDELSGDGGGKKVH